MAAGSSTGMLSYYFSGRGEVWGGRRRGRRKGKEKGRWRRKRRRGGEGGIPESVKYFMKYAGAFWDMSVSAIPPG